VALESDAFAVAQIYDRGEKLVEGIATALKAEAASSTDLLRRHGYLKCVVLKAQGPIFEGELLHSIKPSDVYFWSLLPRS
jgi:hypothetical protein